MTLRPTVPVPRRRSLRPVDERAGAVALQPREDVRRGRAPVDAPRRGRDPLRYAVPLLVPLLVSVVGLDVGCLFDGAVDQGAGVDGAVIACGADEHCPDGMACGDGGRCVDALAERRAPALESAVVDPPVAASGPISVTITTDEELGSPPRPVGLRADAVSGSGRTFTIRLLADVLAEGVHPIVLSLVDRVGNRADVDAGIVVIDRRPPQVLLVTNSRPILRPGAPVSIRVALDEPVRSAVLEVGGTPLTPSVSELGLLAFEFPAPVVEGPHELVLAAVEDRAGNPLARTNIGTLTVDAVPPSVALAPLARARFSAVPGFAQIDNDVLVDADAALTVVLALADGTEVPVPCDEDHRCSLAVGDDAEEARFAEGPAVLRAVATDVAGNIGIATRGLEIDLTPPAALGVAAVDATSAPGALPGPLTAGATLDVIADFDEALAATPDLELVDAAGVPVPFEVLGERSWRLVVPFGAAGGPVSIRARAVTDVVGNAADVVLPLRSVVRLAGGGAGARCVPAAGGCVDFDADGAFGASDDCAAATDCDDTNPLIGPDAPEIPGDGVANACGGEEQPVDESTGVFASPAGSDDDDGTRDAPVRSFVAAMGRARERGLRHVFLQTGTYVETTLLRADVSVHGGFDAAWARTAGARSVLAAPTLATGQVGPAQEDVAMVFASTGDPIVLSGIEARTTSAAFHTLLVVQSARAVIADCVVRGDLASGVVRTNNGVAVQNPGALVTLSGAGSIVVRSVVKNSASTSAALRCAGSMTVTDSVIDGALGRAYEAMDFSNVVIDRSVVVGQVISTRAATAVTLTSSLAVMPNPAFAIVIAGGARAAVSGSTVRQQSVDRPVALVTDPQSRIDVVASVLDGGNAGIEVELSGIALLARSVVTVPDAMIIDGASIRLSPAAVANCTTSGCDPRSSAVQGMPANALVPIAVPIDSTDARFATVPASVDFVAAPSGPTLAVRDLDGVCRQDGGPPGALYTP